MRQKANPKCNAKVHAGRNAQVRLEVPLLERLTLRVPEAVAVCGVSRTKLFELIATGALPSRKIAGCRVIGTADLRRLMTGSAVAANGSTSTGDTA